MKFGASSWPFQWDPPYETCIKRVASLGFKAIELIAWNKDYLKDYYTPETIRTLKSALAGEGLSLSQFVSTPHDLSSPDAAKREAAIDHWKRAVDVGVELGSPIINMVSTHAFAMKDSQEIPRITTKPLVQTFAAKVPRGVDWDRNFEDYVAALKVCAAYCEKAGVMLSIEPHPARYVANTDGALRLLEHVNSKAVGINFDPSHTFPVGDFPNISVYRLGRKIIHCHVSDNDGVTNVHWRPGMGKIDWTAMFQALKDVGYDGVISIELEDVPGVSRGPNSTAPGVYRNPTATDEFVAETVAGMNYLKAICKDLGITVE
ncbi:sugar phosphate isomerase/epimerase [Alsobacter sp. SYSU M60028]|uniref:Sugar phosphate isomerase/epimerase n=1 Tax=Alsobacter ponti TaxID=2962936 RepID=A0ABT1LCC6_9HYPH|nr:sugar phosphate isomerase/epimerase family protein [Alsobacter ponti]MCP8938558.1 sugar phosphate isomerase/epimerase [Alsobacter ponti]